MIRATISKIEELRHPTGLFSAAKSHSTGYHRAWIRDNIYAILGFEAVKKQDVAVKTLHALLDVLLKHEYKIEWAIIQKPQHAYQYIHARYDPQTLEEIWEPWGNKQNDAIGALLWKTGDLERKGVKVLRDVNDRRIVQKLVRYLESIEYWHDADNGMWEENEEIHASSVGACIAGLKSVKAIVHVPDELIWKGECALEKLLPCESATKETDMALLSLIWPYNVVTPEQRDKILNNIERNLVRERGVCRYLGDRYYNEGGEAEWTMGLAWLAVIYKEMKIPHKHAFYLEKCKNAMNEKGELPELYFANSSVHNENTPLAWAHSLLAVAAV